MKKAVMVLAVSAIGLVAHIATGSDGGNAQSGATPSEDTTDNPEMIHRPVSLALAPYATTDGGASGPVVNNFSINFIGWGHTLHGAEMSAIGAIRTGEVLGLQLSCAFNYTQGEMRGAQVSGLFNTAAGSLTGVQGSGLLNLALGSGLSGVQDAGLANVSLGHFRGLQASGIANYAEGGVGAQLSGISNVATHSFHGVQIGLINYASEMKGAQIGLINIAAKKMKGAPIGLINYAGDGVLAGRFWVADNSLLNVGVKMGSKHVYSVLGYGVHPLGKKNDDALIVGLGGHTAFTERLWLDVDLTHYWMHKDYDWVDDADKEDYEIKLGATVGYRIVDALSLFAGPSLDLMVSTEREENSFIGYQFATWSRDDRNVALSPGFIAGIQIPDLLTCTA